MPQTTCFNDNAVLAFLEKLEKQRISKPHIGFEKTFEFDSDERLNELSPEINKKIDGLKKLGIEKKSIKSFLYEYDADVWDPLYIKVPAHLAFEYFNKKTREHEIRMKKLRDFNNQDNPFKLLLYAFVFFFLIFINI